MAISGAAQQWAGVGGSGVVLYLALLTMLAFWGVGLKNLCFWLAGAVITKISELLKWNLCFVGIFDAGQLDLRN